MNMLYKYALLKAMRGILGAPERAFSVRSLAKESGISVGASKQSLDYMLSMGMVKLEKIGRTYQYQTDLESQLSRHWKMVFNLEDIRDAGIRSRIMKANPNVISASVYGSFAKGDNGQKSDVDLLIIADMKKGFELEMEGREVNVHTFTPQEWRKHAERNKAFYEQVILNCIALIGERPVVR
jgi:predicted nucleotidyltransferase